MAFPKAAGHGNLPNGNFSPIIYSKQVQLAFRKSSIAEAITNNDYFGEIAAMGDSVKIIKEPEITVKSYERGTQITPQDLDDEEFSLVIDKANYFAFKIDDIEEAHSHVNFQSLASDRAAYRLADQFDQEVLGYMSGFSQTALHTNASTVNTSTNGVAAVTGASTGANLVGAELLASMSLDASDFTNTSGSAGSANNSIGIEPRAGGATAAKSGTAGNSCPLKFLVPALIPAENLSKLLNSPVISVSRCNNEPTTLKLFVGYHSREASNPVISDSGTLTSPPKEPKIKSSNAPKTCLSL